MSSAGVEPLAAEAARAAAEAVGVPAAMADLNVFRMLLRHQRVARAVNDLLSTLLFKSELDARLRELIIMRIGWLTGSEYEWTQHWRVARAVSNRSSSALPDRAHRACAGQNWMIHALRYRSVTLGPLRCMISDENTRTPPRLTGTATPSPSPSWPTRNGPAPAWWRCVPWRRLPG